MATKKDLSDVVVVLDVDDTLYPYSYALACAVRRFPQYKSFNLSYERPDDYDLTKAWQKHGFTRKLWDQAHLGLVINYE